MSYHNYKNKFRIIIGSILVFLLFACSTGFVWRYLRRGAPSWLSLEYRDASKEEKAKTAKPKIKSSLVKFFPFSRDNDLDEWEEKIFKGRVVYKIEKDKGLSYVKAISDAKASALYYKIKMDAKNRYPVVSWKWNVEKFPVKKSKEDLEKQEEDDFAARVYVIFPAGFILNSRVLEYIWSETLPVGTMGTSSYSKNIKLIVLRSGASPNKEWQSEDRDIVADYMKAFGKTPEYDMGAVAFMTNTEHTGTNAIAMYDDIRLGYKEEPEREGGDKRAK